ERVREEHLGRGLAAGLIAAGAWAASLLGLKPALGGLDPITTAAGRPPRGPLVLFRWAWGGGAPRQVLTADRSMLRRVALLGVITAMSSVLFVTSVKLADVAGAGGVSRR